jgi:transposase
MAAGVKNNHPPTTPTTQLAVKTLLNLTQPLRGFVYAGVRLVDAQGTQPKIEVHIEPHAQCQPRCSHCELPCPGYDRLAERRWLFVPVWGLTTEYFYPPRRVQCPTHGVVVEHMPWNTGKQRITTAMMGFLARWGRRLSWRETARVFGTSWETVFRSVEWFVEWGLAHRKLEGVEAIGVDEIHWGRRKKGAEFLTVIYQIDRHCRRLLWVGPRRTQASLRNGLKALGPEVIKGVRFVCSDMWRPYLNVIARHLGHALHILDRFHIVGHLNRGVDQVRRAEMTRLHGQPRAQRLKKMRWQLLRRGSRVRGHARIRLHQLVRSKLATARAWILKEAFQHFWTYRSPRCAAAFLQCWCRRALRSRLEPLCKVARMLRRHDALLLNWFRAKGELSSGVVEGLNNKVRVVTRRAYGFRTYRAMEVALYHNLGHLPEPELTHRFC